MAWTYILIAGVIEVVWVFTMKLSEGFTQMVPSLITIVLIVVSFFLISKAMRFISVGTAYAVFTGIGTVGAVLIEFITEPQLISVLKVFFILFLITGIIGLKVTEKEDPEASEVNH
ncbi:ligand-binding protein SH3 [Pontibacillus chungwhensis BH030062]|uniref:Ligand-binding protein SH3 n=1 Tax=Pontibacillus chungwhensis BH030062 TaxID=1385513 RepID=A0A0A2V0H3_9BACI|nr:multidrug efflux SMR transporter [Pontibacillus chungwhensis]KGP92291.1 ligand-binding protein SH3 [Pontibacillus chungwhensis BH030062]